MEKGKGIPMRIPMHKTLMLAALLGAAFVLLQGGIAPPTAEAANACYRHGDDRPGQLNKKHARNAVICLINKKRRENGRGRLDRDGRLNSAARSHSNTMASKNCFSHQCSGEPGLEQRLRNVGYLVSGLSRWAYGENIAWGTGSQGTPRQVVNGWMSSPSHRSVILSGTFRDVGAAFARRDTKGFYTADFGLRRR